VTRPLLLATYNLVDNGKQKRSGSTGAVLGSGSARGEIACWRQVVPFAVLVALATSVAACGDESAPGVASAGSTTTTRPRAPAHAAATDAVKFAQCMREHGILNWPDPLPGGGFDLPAGIKHEPQFQAASQACGRYLVAGHLKKHVNVQEELTFSICMRSHGITDFPDPLPGGGWNIPGNTTSPQFEAAARQCQSTGIHWNGPP
jgi:hypothetical protein